MEIHAEILSMRLQAAEWVASDRDEHETSLHHAPKVPNMPTLTQVQQHDSLFQTGPASRQARSTLLPLPRPLAASPQLRTQHSPRPTTRCCPLKTMMRSPSSPAQASPRPSPQMSPRALHGSQTALRQASPRLLPRPSPPQPIALQRQSPPAACSSTSSPPCPTRLQSGRMASPQNIQALAPQQVGWDFQTEADEAANSQSSQFPAPQPVMVASARSKTEGPTHWPSASPERFCAQRIAPVRQSTPLEAHVRPWRCQAPPRATRTQMPPPRPALQAKRDATPSHSGSAGRLVAVIA